MSEILYVDHACYARGEGRHIAMRPRPTQVAPRKGRDDFAVGLVNL